MIRAYSELYVSDAARALGNSIDYAVLSLGFSLDEYYSLFIASDLAPRFEKGDPYIVAGRSGVELALLVAGKRTGKFEYRDRLFLPGRSREYWTGWALAHYQWYSGDTFININETVPVTSVIEMYDKYHETDIMHFVDRVSEIRALKRKASNLAKYREAYGYSQSELSTLTGIPLRTLQHYEQGSKSLAKANVSYVLKLAAALGCDAGQLIADDTQV